MKIYLLDVNVLLALAWPNHVHHEVARSWFRRRGRQAWATCPMTQCGFVRVSSNPAIIRDAASPGEALALLKQMTAHPGHHFWTDERSIAAPEFTFPGLLTGHRQVSDAYLLSLAILKKGMLATLDHGIKALSTSGTSVELISERD